MKDSCLLDSQYSWTYSGCIVVSLGARCGASAGLSPLSSCSDGSPTASPSYDHTGIISAEPLMVLHCVSLPTWQREILHFSFQVKWIFVEMGGH